MNKILLVTISLFSLASVAYSQASTYPIQWATLVNADTVVAGSEDAITNTRTNNCWCSGAISSTTLLEDSNGYISHKVNGLKTFILGFYESEPVNVYTPSLIDYGLYGHSNGTLYAREGSSSINIGTWASGDTLELKRSNDTIYYYQNGTQLRSKTATVTSDWLIGLMINTGSAQFENIRTNFNNETIVADLAVTNVPYSTSTGGSIDLTPSGGASPYTYLWSQDSQTSQDISTLEIGTYTVTITDNYSSTKVNQTGIGYFTDWEGLVRMDFSNGDLINDYSGNAWFVNGAMSFNTLPPNTDGWVEYKVQLNASGKYDSKVFGLTTDDHLDITYYTDIDYLLTMSPTGEYRVRNKGTYSSLYGSYKPGDIFRVERLGTKIKYSKNGVLVDSITVSASEELKVQANIYTVDGKFEKIRCSFGNKFDTYAEATEIQYNGIGTGSIDMTVSGDHSPFTYEWSPGIETAEDIYDLQTGDYLLTITNTDNISFTNQVGIGYPINWDRILNPATMDTVGDTLRSTNSTNGFLYIASAENTLYQGNDGWIEYTVVDMEDKVFGLRDANDTTLAADASEFDYVFALSKLGYIQKSIANTNTVIGYANSGDVLRVEKKGTNIIFKKNGKSLDTVAISDTMDLMATAYMTQGLAKFEGVRASFNNDFPNISGTYTVGSVGSDFTTVSEAVASINNSNLSESVVFVIQEGVYGDSILLDSNITFTRDSSHYSILFTTNRIDTAGVVIQADSLPLEIANWNDVYFNNITFKTTQTGARAISITNSDDIYLYKVNVQASNTGGQAISINNVDKLLIQGCSISSFDYGIKASNSDTNTQILQNQITVNETAIYLNNMAELAINRNDLSNADNGSQLIKAIDLSGPTEISGNNITSYDEEAIYISGCLEKTTVSGNSIIDSNGTAIYISSFADTLDVSDNTINSYQGNGILINDTISSDTLYDSTKVISIIGNDLVVDVSGIKVRRIKNSHLDVFANRVDSAHTAMYFEKLATASQSTDSLLLGGNLLIGDSIALYLDSCYLRCYPRANTFVTNKSTSARTVVVDNSNNLDFCANIAANLSGNEAVYFSGTPSTITTSYNNWYSINASNISNLLDSIVSSTDSTVNPLFKSEVLGDTTPNRYALSHKSILLDKAQGCWSSDISKDINGEFRYTTFDPGAIENPTTGWDSLQIKFVLENDIAFTAGGSGTYTDFEIDGLTNYTSVLLKVYAADTGGGSNILVHQSTSKTIYWDGTDTNTSQYVDEGGYRYELTLDSYTIKGLLYVRR